MKIFFYCKAASLAYYLKIWWLMSKNSFLTVLAQKLGFVIFLTGKLFRFGFFIFFLIFLVKGTNTLAGYSLNQTIFFFLTFNLVDVVAQFLFREVYRFRPQVVSGSFDLILTKPMNALFRSLLGGADIIDLVTIPPLIFALYWVGSALVPSVSQIILYLLLLGNALLVATAFHIAVISLGIITLEIDHTIMIYRDLVALGRFPIDIYRQPLRGILTYFIPVAIMISLPAKALIGLASPLGIISCFVIGVMAIFIALKFWNFALKYYTSASS
jgi:ABC-2 type transport system permease protein